MPSPAVIVMGYSEASMLLRGADADEVRAIIAIHGQREFAVDTDGVEHGLVLQFDDSEAPDEEDMLQASLIQSRQRDAAEIGLQLTPPNVEHARQIVEFARSIAELDGTLLCHCQAGVSRGPAAALLCLATWTEPGHEQACVEHLLAIRHCAMPHPDLVAFGDEVLGRGGSLVAAVEEFIAY